MKLLSRLRQYCRRRFHGNRFVIASIEFNLPDRAYKKTGSAPSFYIPLGGQLIIGNNYSRTRNTQLDSKAARWRQTMILLQLAINNILPEYITNLGEQGNAGVSRQSKCSSSQIIQIGLLKLKLIGYFKLTKISIICN